jgi:hypothetical protein
MTEARVVEFHWSRVKKLEDGRVDQVLVIRGDAHDVEAVCKRIKEMASLSIDLGAR